MNTSLVTYSNIAYFIIASGPHFNTDDVIFGHESI